MVPCQPSWTKPWRCVPWLGAQHMAGFCLLAPASRPVCTQWPADGAGCPGAVPKPTLSPLLPLRRSSQPGEGCFILTHRFSHSPHSPETCGTVSPKQEGPQLGGAAGWGGRREYSQWKLKPTRMTCTSRSSRDRTPRLRGAQCQGSFTGCGGAERGNYLVSWGLRVGGRAPKPAKIGEPQAGRMGGSPGSPGTAEQWCEQELTGGVRGVPCS